MWLRCLGLADNGDSIRLFQPPGGPGDGGHGPAAHHGGGQCPGWGGGYRIHRPPGQGTPDRGGTLPGADGGKTLPQLLVGEELARSGVQPVLDYFAQDVELGLGAQLWLVRGATAREAVSSGGEEGADSRLETLQNDSKMGIAAISRTAGEVYTDLLELGAAFVPALTPAGDEIAVLYEKTGRRPEAWSCWPAVPPLISWRRREQRRPSKLSPPIRQAGWTSATARSPP